MKKLIGLALLLLVGLTGCISAYDLTEDEAGIISEYASSIVLKHDRSYTEELTDAGKPKEKTPKDKDVSGVVTKDTDETVSDENGGSSSASGSQGDEAVNKEPTQVSLSKVAGKGGFTIKYNSYSLYDTYPKNVKDSGYVVSAQKNGKLLIAELTVKNTTKAKKKFKTISEKWEITLDSAKDDAISVSYYPSITVLSNMLQYADVSIDAGKSKKMVIVFEVPAKINYDNYSLKVKKGNLISVNKLK